MAEDYPSSRRGGYAESEANPGVSAENDASSLRADPMCAVYRHDIHKFRSRSHDAAADEFRGTPVNERVPLGADGDAASLSRPGGEPEPTVANHVSPYRLSLLTGSAATEEERLVAMADAEMSDLVEPEDPEVLHARWLTSRVAAAYNESVAYPYTSLKYHVLLTAALLDAYRAGHAFDDVWLVATPTQSPGGPDETQGVAARCLDAGSALAADGVVPHRTVLWTPPVALHVTPESGARPAARLGGAPARSFADAWSRLPAHPVDTDERRWRVLDAQCRRIRSWSTALQFIAEYVRRHGTGGGEEQRWRGEDV